MGCARKIGARVAHVGEGGAGTDEDVLAERHAVPQRDVRLKPGSRSNARARAHEAERADHGVRPELGFGVDDRGRIHHRLCAGLCAFRDAHRAEAHYTRAVLPRLAIATLAVALAVGSTGCRKRKKIDDETLSLAVGARHACVLMTDKGVRCWGANESGQLGEVSREPHPIPARLRGTTDRYVELEAGGSLTCARTESKTVECWGAAHLATTAGQEPIPIDVSGLKDVEQIAVGANHACVRLETGLVRCFGANDRGQLGIGHTDRVKGHVEVAGLWGVTWISTGREHSCAVVTDGSARCWGRNHEGQLGNGTTKDSATPVTVELAGVKRVAAGGAHSCALMNDETIRCWGKNDQGQLGDGTKVRHPISTPVTGLIEQKGVATGDAFSCSWGADAVVRCWGANDHSQMADGTREARPTPHRIVGFTGQGITAVPERPVAVLEVKMGEGFTCVRASDRRVRCWGRNDVGQAGDGTREVRGVPVGVKLAKPTD
jgi:alpha-tubulin suppressor-like RCC1 family protein